MVDPRPLGGHTAAVFAEVEQMSHLGGEHGVDCHLPFLSFCFCRAGAELSPCTCQASTYP